MKFDLIDPPHQDLINDIAFDYYGKRFATCSSDKSIKVWDYDETEKKWKSVYINRAHEDSIWRLSWAHPEFGQIFASCSEDGSVKIWEEREDSDDPKDKWFARAHLLKLSKSVNDIKFAPRNVGLKLATASSDGIIRIIEPKDLFNLASENFNIKFEYQMESIVPNSDPKVLYSEHGLTCLSWNTTPFEPVRIVVGGYSKHAIIFNVLDNGLQLELDLGENTNAVSDLAWAPSMGRSFHLIACACRDTTCKIFKLSFVEGSTQLKLDNVILLKSPTDSNIWRVEWNVTGTLLATTSEDGKIILWKKDYKGEWTHVQEVTTENKLSYFHGSV